MSEESRPLGGDVVTKPFKIFAAFALFAGLLVAYRYVAGIGAVTNLSDGFPWGIWITYDVVVGTAFACGGYSLALLVYVLNRGEYHPLVRPALMASMFGYTLAGLSIFFDIGRYWQAYNMFLPWRSNVNSIMLEVAVCIALYILVLWIEFSPAFIEGWKSVITPLLEKADRYLPRAVVTFSPEGVLKWLRKNMFVFIAIGVLLPTMHQSSLGTLMVVAGRKLSPLWQTGFLPLLFLISAITMGYAIVVFESIVSSLGFKRPQETALIGKLSGVFPVLIAAYLAIRLGDLLVRGAFGALKADVPGFMFILENLLYVLPLAILAVPKNRANSRMLFVSSISLLLAGSVYRFNTYLVGFNPGDGWSYFPSFAETMITFGIVSFEILAYLVFVKKFSVLPKAEHA
jgi:Ni/Fe-hydrogenase subunit HybB-like protein